MKNYLPLAYLAFVLALFTLMTFEASARDKEREFRKERPRQRGNERSERVHRVPTGQISYAGNGCPAGTMRVAFAPDNLSFSILFDQFVAEIAETARGRDAMNCSAVIPIEIPPNMQMEITRVDFRGFVNLPQRFQANLHSVFQFRGRGTQGDRLNLRFRFAGPVMDNYEISTNAMNANGRTQESELSPCGGPAQLHVSNKLTLLARGSREAAQVTIDSIDGASNAVYYVNWRSCSPGGPGRGGRP